MIIFKTKEEQEDKHLKLASGINYAAIRYMPTSFVLSDSFKDKNDLFVVPNSERTLVFYLHMDIFHFLFDGINTIIREHKKNKDTLFVCIVQDLADFEKQSYSRFFNDFIQYHNIKINIVEVSKIKDIEVKDVLYYIPKGIHPDEDMSNNIFEYFSPFVKNKDTKPFRKIYLSRSQVGSHSPERLFAGKDPDLFLFNNDIRVDDEKELEVFLQNNGYEIIYPESITNFKDQVNLMYETKELISLTGSGLMNIMFMQRNQSVIELSTPLVMYGQTSLHPFYYEISHISRHNYTSIPHSRSVNDIKLSLIKYWEGK